jgi:hypothetical protein
VEGDKLFRRPIGQCDWVLHLVCGLRGGSIRSLLKLNVEN